MASMNGTEGTSSHTPDTVLCESLKVIKIDKDSADSSYEANGTLQKSKETARGYKICCLETAEESNDMYQDILTCIALGNNKKTEIIQASVDMYIKKDDEIEKLIKDSSKLLNTMRVKIEEAHNAACAMSNCVKNKVFPKSGKSSSKMDDNLVDIEHLLTKILNKTKTLDEKGQNAFESVVIIAGIQTFTNTASLKDFAKSLTESMKAFKECVEANIKSTGGDITKTREELNVIVEELAVIVCDKKASHTTKQGLCDVIDFVCKSECDDDCLDLCKEIKECAECGGGNNGETHYKKNKKQSADQN